MVAQNTPTTEERLNTLVSNVVMFMGQMTTSLVAISNMQETYDRRLTELERRLNFLQHAVGTNNESTSANLNALAGRITELTEQAAKPKRATRKKVEDAGGSGSTTG